ncbi:hypothetical protein OKA05_14710 [Luteolibacter arcticus]|uniref:Uncharacterized protein n=1 Tax=Luteolibacter arcticus TaxID=1581411 RepID=A0ABT3GK20_9BACT|nr:hypothetical protein [Luteolibacter arcticus]MCW1923816.1 hypothetical protein [Luteolibacter arcticus]
MNGYLPHAVVKAVVFWVLTACIVASTLAGILLAWGTIGEELARRCFWTAFILSFGSMIFLLTNYIFGNLEQGLFGDRNHTPSADPAFAERLRKAKEFRAGGTDSKIV